MCVYPLIIFFFFFFFSSRRRHTRFDCDWSSDVCSSDLLAYRRGSTALRLRVYHQSSHLGDEYMLHARAQRVDLSFEAAELLVARELAHWRVYGGGEYMFTHSPSDLKPGVLHAGLEYHQPGSLVRLRRLAAGPPPGGVGGRTVGGRGWGDGWGVVPRVRPAAPPPLPPAPRRWGVR